jgi:hypothetical protein
MVFKIICCLFVKNTKIKCLRSSPKLPTNCENTSSDSLQRACASGHLCPECDPKAGQECTLKKIGQGNQGKVRTEI